MSISPQQHALRRQGITATDIAAIAGVHPYRAPLDVFLEKTGQAEPFEGNDRTRWGDLLEPLIRTDYEERHNVRVEVHGTMLRGEAQSWWLYTPDGFVFPRGARVAERGLEIKVHGRDAVFFGGLEYGAPGTDEVPPHELIQCAWSMGGSGLEHWDLVAFLDGSPVEFTIDRDDDLIAMLGEAGEKFLVDHVRTGTPPEPDGSNAWSSWLKRRWETNTAELVPIDDTPELLSLVFQLRQARDEEAAAETLKDAITQRLKLAIGDKAGLTWREAGQRKPQRVTWKRSADGVRDAWQTTARAMATDAGVALSANADVLAELLVRLRTESESAASALELVFSTMRSIATRPPSTVAVPGNRPFNVPRWWKSATKTDEKPDNTEEI